MGTRASVQIFTDTYVESNAACDNCTTTEEAAMCSKCKKTLCATCCPHKHNRLFDGTPVPLCVRNLLYKCKGFQRLEPRCGVYSHTGDVMILAEIFFQDKHCKCCSETTEWKVLKVGNKDGNKSGTKSERIHKEDRHVIFPGDICTSAAHKLTYFTMPCEKTIYRFDERMDYKKPFQTTGSCFGITAFESGLAVSVQIKTAFCLESDWQIQLLDVKGEIRRQIYKGSDGGSLFKEPLFLASDAAESVLFVSDKDLNAVFALDMSGEVLFKYTHENIRAPLGLDVDSEQNIYVACGKSVVQIEKGGKTCREWISIKNQDFVTDVCVNKMNDQVTTVQKTRVITTFVIQ